MPGRGGRGADAKVAVQSGGWTEGFPVILNPPSSCSLPLGSPGLAGRRDRGEAGLAATQAGAGEAGQGRCGGGVAA